MSNRNDISAQALIRQFLQSNLPSFQSISDIDPDLSEDENDDKGLSSIAGGDSPSVSLSLPDSFDMIGIAVTEQQLALQQRQQSVPRASSDGNRAPRAQCVQ